MKTRFKESLKNSGVIISHLNIQQFCGGRISVWINLRNTKAAHLKLCKGETNQGPKMGYFCGEPLGETDYFEPLTVLIYVEFQG